MPIHLSCLQVQGKKDGRAIQGIAGQWGQLASRTVVHLTDEYTDVPSGLDSGASTWASIGTVQVVHLHGLQGQCYITSVRTVVH